MPALAAIALEGAKAVGKTATANQRAKTVYRLDDETQRSIAEADLDRVLDAVKPILIDEWQHVPPIWDKVRRAVDDGAAPGSFLLAARPSSPTERSSNGYSCSTRSQDGSHPGTNSANWRSLPNTISWTRHSLRSC
jgi:hypothetical protein